MTAHRRAVLEVMLDRNDHPTADQVFESVRNHLPGISRTSVYRVLDMLVKTGTLSRVSHPGAATRYDAGIHQHHHLICSRCGQIVDLDDPTLDQLSLPDVGKRDFKISGYSVQFYGLCGQCLDSPDQPPGSPAAPDS
ncbi:MAG: transcriptional repressor [Phycisphaeraceae bacterium]|nr:transcriptional repressor [Phycisphaeraceae bacterium]